MSETQPLLDEILNLKTLNQTVSNQLEAHHQMFNEQLNQNMTIRTNLITYEKLIQGLQAKNGELQEAVKIATEKEIAISEKYNALLASLQPKVEVSDAPSSPDQVAA